MKKSDCHHIDIKIYFLNVLIFIHWINHFITIDSDLPWNTFAPGIAGKCIFIFFHFQEGHNNDNKPVVRLPKEQVCLELRDFFSSFQQKSITKCKSVWQELICLVLVCCMDLHTFPGKTNCIWFIIYCLICGSIFLSPICRPYTLV